jgi:hypothetical protein
MELTDVQQRVAQAMRRAEDDGQEARSSVARHSASARGRVMDLAHRSAVAGCAWLLRQWPHRLDSSPRCGVIELVYRLEFRPIGDLPDQFSTII